MQCGAFWCGRERQVFEGADHLRFVPLFLAAFLHDSSKMETTEEFSSFLVSSRLHCATRGWADFVWGDREIACTICKHYTKVVFLQQENPFKRNTLRVKFASAAVYLSNADRAIPMFVGPLSASRARTSFPTRSSCWRFPRIYDHSRLRWCACFCGSCLLAST